MVVRKGSWWQGAVADDGGEAAAPPRLPRREGTANAPKMTGLYHTPSMSTWELSASLREKVKPSLTDYSHVDNAGFALRFRHFWRGRKPGVAKLVSPNRLRQS